MTLRKAAQTAIDAWDKPRRWPFPVNPNREFDDLRAAFAQPIISPEIKGDKAEPVAWIFTPNNELLWPSEVEIGTPISSSFYRPLFAAPPQRKPLTDDQIAEICMDCSLVTPSDIYFARAIERAHGIGND